MNFDLGLAKERSQKNPVYYVQYAYARMSGIMNKIKTPAVAKALAGKQKSKVAIDLKFLNHPSEVSLMRQLVKFPEIIGDVAVDYQVQRLPQYTIDLVITFHKFYEDCRVITDDKKLTQARLALVQATRIVLKNSLDLMGISAPERM